MNLTGTGQGAAACTINVKLDRSNAARSSSGISRMRMKWAGTINERVPRRRATSASHDRASNCSVITVTSSERLPWTTPLGRAVVPDV